MSHIEEMMAIAGGVLRGNRFKMKVYFPPILALLEETNTIEFYVMSDSIPGKTVGTIEVPVVGGAKFKVPGDVVVPDFSFSYMHDTNMKIRKAFDKWIEYIYSNATGMSRNDATVFGNVEITQLSTTDDVVNIWEMLLVFPSDPGSVEHDKGSNDEYMTSDVSLIVNDIQSLII